MSSGAPTMREAFPGRGRSYWEQRARRFATDGDGLRAVCSYGMPGFYNSLIDRTQKLALRPWLDVVPGERVLDVGCGVGRFSHFMARRGALVTGIDLSETMIEQARARATYEGIGERCHFEVGDVSSLETASDVPFDRILSVTVLQHLLSDGDFASAFEALAANLSDGGRLVLLEAAPTSPSRGCDTPVFVARTLDQHLAALAKAGLECEAVTGVDPAPFKTWLLPVYRELPGIVALPALAVATLAAAPIDLLFGRRWVARSWHKVIVARKRAS